MRARSLRNRRRRGAASEQPAQREGAIPLPISPSFIFGDGGMELFASLLRRAAKNDREEPSGGGGKDGGFLNPPPEEIMGATRPQSPCGKGCALATEFFKEACERKRAKHGAGAQHLPAPLQQSISEDGEERSAQGGSLALHRGQTCGAGLSNMSLSFLMSAL